MSEGISYLKFGDLSKSVKFYGCDELIDCLGSVFPGWKIMDVVQQEPGESPILSVKRESDAYYIDGFWLDKPMRRVDKVDAACGLVAEVTRAYVREDSQLLCLHGASAKFAGKLVIFPSRYRSGKSVLSACLASAGIELYGDDVLPISMAEGKGIAPGLALRLRRPLPENLTEKSLDFIYRHSGLTGKNYQYLNLGNGLLAEKGAKAPIGAFVLLEREAGATATFEKTTEAEVLRQVVWQNFAREGDAPRILEALSHLVANSQYYRLRFDRAEDAAELLQDKFSAWPADRKPLSRKVIESNAGIGGSLLPGYFLRMPTTSIVKVGDDSFLADRHGEAIHHLNTIGTAIWTTLAEPMRIDDMVELLQAAFPDINVDSTRREITELIKTLISKGLLLRGTNNEPARETDG